MGDQKRGKDTNDNQWNTLYICMELLKKNLIIEEKGIALGVSKMGSITSVILDC